MQKVKLYQAPWIAALFGVLAVTLAVCIFLLSAEPATDSAERSGGIAVLLLEKVMPSYQNLPEEEQMRIEGVADHYLRKTAHFCMYGLLGILICLAFGYMSSRPRTHVLRTLLFGALYAASDEIHQAFVPGRGPLVTDVLLDGAGVLTGAIFVVGIWCLLKRKRNVA